MITSTMGAALVVMVSLMVGIHKYSQTDSEKAHQYKDPTTGVVRSLEEVATAKALLEDRIEGALLGAAIGDALGRVTEFIETTEAIKLKYGPQGITSFKSFNPGDWVMHPYTRECIAAYTDDTVMARIVFEESLRFTNDKNFIRDVSARFRRLFGKEAYEVDPLYHVRAHGIQNRAACTRPVVDLAILMQPSPEYDTEVDSAVAQEGGCGSVMRAWPLGLAFYTDLEKVARLADYQSRITHRHPMARAASAAIAVGIASLLQKADPDSAVAKMIEVAQKFEEAEKIYKPGAHKFLEPIAIAEDKLLTSDMIAYAAQQARAGVAPELVLGTHNTKKHFRSVDGFLLGWSADEAVAAAVYVFLRNPQSMVTALQESVNTPGDSDSIATLAAALVGAHSGWKSFSKTGFDYSALENKIKLEDLVDTAMGRAVY